jgi:hypothetical protein
VGVRNRAPHERSIGHLAPFGNGRTARGMAPDGFDQIAVAAAKQSSPGIDMRPDS